MGAHPFAETRKTDAVQVASLPRNGLVAAGYRCTSRKHFFAVPPSIAPYKRKHSIGAATTAVVGPMDSSVDGFGIEAP